MPRSDRNRKRVSAKRRLEFGNDDQQDAEKGIQAKSPAVSIVPLHENERDDLGKGSSAILMTPVKKRRRRGSNDKQGIASYFSAQKTADARKISVLVTPEQKEEEEKETESKDERQEQEYVPIYIHKNLNYQRRGQAPLNSKLKRAFDLVEEYYVIPSNFESDRSYGPLSGTCFEERVVNAYDKGFLLPCEPSKGGVLICAYCSKLGHRQDDCPDLT